MTADANTAIRAFALANSAFQKADSAYRRAETAHKRADDAVDGNRSIYEALGGLTREMSGVKGQMSELSRQTDTAIRELKKASRVSHHRIDDLEDSQVRDLKKELAEANRRLARKHAHSAKLFWWSMGLFAAIFVAVLTALLSIHK